MLRKLFCAILVLILVGACTRRYAHRQSSPSVFIVAVESLGYDLPPCIAPQELVESGAFDFLCDEALRFTHLYAPSPLSQPALMSLFTGQSLEQHRVFHNGTSRLSVASETLAERALVGRRRTSLFSAGPPLLSKLGVSQGFELFSDDFMSYEQPYKTAPQLLSEQIKWLRGQGSSSVFSVSYLVDLQFTSLTSFNADGFEREKSTKTQMSEIETGLSWYFNQLKKSGYWDSSYVVVLGLNGARSVARPGFTWRNNLFRENVHIPLFVKPPQAVTVETDIVDALLSLDDIYHLISKFLDGRMTDSSSLEQWIEQVETKEAHKISVRSDWNQWWFAEPIEYSFRTYDYVFFPRDKGAIYHTLVDKTESLPISEAELESDVLEELQVKISESLDRPSLHNNELKGFIGRLHENFINDQSPLRSESESVDNHFAKLVQADVAVATKQWKKLQSLYSKPSVANYLASTHLEQDAEMRAHHPCDAFFLGKSSLAKKRKCLDPLFIALLDWEKDIESSVGKKLEREFIRKYRFFMNYKKMAYLNLMVELNWDLDVNTVIGPSRAELYLSLPEKKHLRRRLREYQIPSYLPPGFI